MEAPVLPLLKTTPSPPFISFVAIVLSEVHKRRQFAKVLQERFPTEDLLLGKSLSIIFGIVFLKGIDILLLASTVFRRSRLRQQDVVHLASVQSSRTYSSQRYDGQVEREQTRFQLLLHHIRWHSSSSTCRLVSLFSLLLATYKLPRISVASKLCNPK